MARTRRSFLVGSVALAGAVMAPASRAQESGRSGPVARMSTEDWSVQVVTDDLSYPWDLNRFGNLLVTTEAGGHIVTIEDGRIRRDTVATSDPIVQDGGTAACSAWHSRRTSARAA